MPAPKLDAIAIFGEAAASHLPPLVDVVAHLEGHSYEFMAPKKYDSVLYSNWRQAERLYWLEILYRAHFAASASLIRTARWVDAMLALVESDNYTAFMAAYRGCLESSADSFYSFGRIVGWLADAHSLVRRGLDGTSLAFATFKELEDELIHFTHARHLVKNEEADAAHRAKQTKEYLQGLADAGASDVFEVYRLLCDVTHPGSESVACYAKLSPTTDGTLYELRSDLDELLISQFCASAAQVSERMIYAGVVPPLLVLRTLNEFNVKEVHTLAVMNIGAERHPLWLKIAGRLRDDRMPEHQVLQSKGKRRSTKRR